jgi:phage FluMu protein Com
LKRLESGEMSIKIEDTCIKCEAINTITVTENILINGFRDKKFFKVGYTCPQCQGYNKIEILLKPIHKSITVNEKTDEEI